MAEQLAKLIRVERSGGHAKLVVDGEEFPWYIAETGAAVNVRRDEAPAVTVTILAERVEVEDALP